MQREPDPGIDGREAHHTLPPAPPSGPSWFALQLRSNVHFKVEESLGGLGFETFLPTVKERHRWSDREKTITRPLFPGYIFVRAQRDHLGGIVRIAGVLHVLGHGSEPEVIPDEQIEDVRRVLASAGQLVECPYVAGQLVRVARGPLAGITGIVKRVAGETRLSVGIELLKRALTVQIDASDLASA